MHVAQVSPLPETDHAAVSQIGRRRKGGLRKAMTGRPLIRGEWGNSAWTQGVYCERGAAHFRAFRESVWV